jgi:hypothetical protein
MKQHTTVHTTAHALQRARQRLDAPDNRTAHRLLVEAWREGITLSWRWLMRLCGVSENRGYATARVYGDIVVIGRGRRVITTWRLTPDSFADLLVRLALGVWP